MSIIGLIVHVTDPAEVVKETTREEMAFSGYQAHQLEICAPSMTRLRCGSSQFTHQSTGVQIQGPISTKCLHW